MSRSRRCRPVRWPWCWAPGWNPTDVLRRCSPSASCHAGPGTVPQYSFDYPDLTRAATWAGTRRPGLSAGDYVRESIRTPEAFLSPVFRGGGPSPMPALSLTDREVDALLAYLLNP